MSTQHFRVNVLLWTVLATGFCVANLAAQSAQSQPDTQAGADNASKQGAVVESLRELYRMPLPTQSTQSQAATQKPTTKVFRMRETNTAKPRPTQEEMNRLGLQHLDAINKSASSAPVGGHDIQSTPNVGMMNDPTGNVARTTTTRPATNANDAMIPTDLTQSPYSEPVYHVEDNRITRRERDLANNQYFNGQPERYGYGNRSPYRYGSVTNGDAYRFGFVQGQNRARVEREAEERNESVLSHHKIHMQRGLMFLRAGDYHKAVASFKLSAESNQRDPASRVYVAHSLFAIGRYREAVQYLNRAFELQPKLPLLTYDIRDDYGSDEDFAAHVKALHEASTLAPNNTDRLMMIGYVLYYTGHRPEAFEPLTKTDRLTRGGHALARRLIENCTPSDVELDKLRQQQRK